MSTNQNLQTILRESLRSYEQARAAHLRSEQAADAEFTRATAELTAAEQAERARLEAAHRTRRAVAAGEQERLGDLAAAVTALEEAARTALAQAGLAHIAGAPVAVDDPPANARRGDAEVTQLFVQAQTGYVALREAILKLAQAQVAAGQWDVARQTLKPLLAEKDAPLYEAALNSRSYCDSQLINQAVNAGEWRKALVHIVSNWICTLRDPATQKILSDVREGDFSDFQKYGLPKVSWRELQEIGILPVPASKDYEKLRAVLGTWNKEIAQIVSSGETIASIHYPEVPSTFDMPSPYKGVLLNRAATGSTIHDRSTIVAVIWDEP